jgi:hypothetical protein
MDPPRPSCWRPGARTMTRHDQAEQPPLHRLKDQTPYVTRLVLTLQLARVDTVISSVLNAAAVVAGSDQVRATRNAVRGMIAIALGLSLFATPAFAYIGPGAGMTVLGALGAWSLRSSSRSLPSSCGRCVCCSAGTITSLPVRPTSKPAFKWVARASPRVEAILAIALRQALCIGSS